MIKSPFSYYPLIWMFSSRKANNLINRIHERSIRIVSGDNESNFENLLEKNKDITIHQRNLQVKVIKVLKIINGYAPSQLICTVTIDSLLACEAKLREIKGQILFNI